MRTAKPHGVRQAEIAIWVSIVVDALLALVDKWMGAFSDSQFFFNLFMYGLLCIIPYKIGRGSNAARYIYAVLFAISALIMLGGSFAAPKLDWIVTILLLPLEVFILYRLFAYDAAEWFKREG